LRAGEIAVNDGDNELDVVLETNPEQCNNLDVSPERDLSTRFFAWMIKRAKGMLYDYGYKHN
jgi:hypothetical protein